jgi:spore maturation protein CgeB
MYSAIPARRDYKYDICFIGTAHSDRYRTVKAIADFTEQYNLSLFLYFYLPSAVMFWVRKIFLQKYEYGDIEEFSFSSLAHDQITSYFRESKVILDINHPQQSGLTSRTFEALGAKRKLITTNKNIVEYDFYNDRNIYVLDRNNPVVDPAFFTS